MRKTFTLIAANKQRDRVLDAVKHDIRKYVRRERRREVPEGADFWDFDCRFGLTQDTAESVHLNSIGDLVNAAAANGADAFYVEILARPATRQASGAGRAPQALPDDEEDGDED